MPSIIPGLFGFGTDTIAGRGGALLRVTNLNDSGAGSLRAALLTVGSRIIVFETSGTIVLSSKLVINSPFVTVAGQTSPSPGINLKNYGISVRTHDVLIQHIRSRVGEPILAGNNDCWEVLGPDGFNVVIDHCSSSWGTDENNSTALPSGQDITYSNCIIAENIGSGGFLLGDNTRRVAIIKTLFAHNQDRSAYFKGDTSGVQLNCLIYDWGGNQAAYHADPEGSGSSLVTIVGNVFKRGLSTAAGRPIRLYSSAKFGTQMYVSDNSDSSINGGFPPVDPKTLVQNEFDPLALVSSPPVYPVGYSALANSSVKNYILVHAGARPNDRDSVDARIIASINAGTGTTITSQASVGGFPILAVNSRTAEAAGLPASPNADDDSDGYTNIEEWLQSLSNALESDTSIIDIVASLTGGDSLIGDLELNPLTLSGFALGIATVSGDLLEDIIFSSGGVALGIAYVTGDGGVADGLVDIIPIAATLIGNDSLVGDGSLVDADEEDIDCAMDYDIEVCCDNLLAT